MLVNKFGERAREWKGMESVMGRLKVLLVARRVRGVAGMRAVYGRRERGREEE